MISTRIRRGAVRTKILIRNKIHSYNSLQVKRSVSLARSLALTVVAARMVFLPVPVVPTAHAAALPDMPADVLSEPPSIPPVNGDLHLEYFKVVSFDAGANDGGNQLVPFSYSASFSPIAIGESQATTEENIAKQKAEEQARLEAEKRKAQQKKVVRAVVNAPAAVVVSGDVAEYVHSQVASVFGENEWAAMSQIIKRESGFNPNSYNSRSGACGLFQALPCSKMGGMELGNQVNWGINYIKNRYGSPSNAWAFWQLHHWY